MSEIVTTKELSGGGIATMYRHGASWVVKVRDIDGRLVYWHGHGKRDAAVADIDSWAAWSV